MIQLMPLPPYSSFIIVYYATKAANIHSYTYKHTVKNKIKFKKKTLKFLTEGATYILASLKPRLVLSFRFRLTQVVLGES